LWGIKVGPVIAGLGLFGIAVALGAQDLFKNLISGIMILMERRFTVGDVILLNSSLESLLSAFKIGSATYTLIKQNFLISLLYNAITIPLAMLGFIIPLIAALSMSFSSLLVVGNSLRIKYKRI